MRSLLDLHDDVLLQILCHIDGKDALHFCLCSKRAYHLAIPRVHATLRKTTYNNADFAVWRDALLSSDPASGKPPVSVLSSLVLVQHGQKHQKVVGAGLVDVLVHATRLHSVAVLFQYGLETIAPRLGEALGMLRSLRSLELGDFGPATLYMLSFLPNARRIESLALSQQFEESPEPRPYLPLATVLSRFSRLQFLKLHIKRGIIPLLDPSVTSETVKGHMLPSLRRLLIVDFSPCTMIDLVPLCPNASCVSFLSILPYGSQYRNIVGDLQWPPLRNFKSCTGSFEWVDPLLRPPRPGLVSRLVHGFPVHVFASSFALERKDLLLFNFFRAVHPSALVLDVDFITRGTKTVKLADALRMDPPLRSLELRFREPGRYLMTLPAALRNLSLVHLAVHIVMGNVEGQETEPAVTRAKIATALRPRPFFDALATLRVLGIGDEMLNTYDADNDGLPEDPQAPDDPRPRRTRWWWHLYLTF
ncbi:uncharacterized protein BXZ73DRAFT_99555 [Epithele typhae]|uniref:uncharacterized protein n=1 Tax=Epithele typhae TaxID=378194 RepID=UPI0020084C18|nr:uncharacterized protein BXZ73DRAFT_99555 [Epithele typhae]KAH9939352.1 hypothetical protein BXZ73DRAFT_99555 [Epithele typhae]